MRTGSAWSRSEWLRRLGFKTGDEPPIAVAIQPTLRSGDASELLPPLLAPQGWADARVAAGGAGTYSALEVTGAVGGTFIKPDVIAAWLLHLSDTRPAAFTPGAAADIETEVGPVKSACTEGVFSSLPTHVQFGTLAVATLVEFVAPTIYIGPGRRGYVIQFSTNQDLVGAVHVRDVPVGSAPD